MFVVCARTYAPNMVVAWLRRAGASFLGHLTWSINSFVPEYGHLTWSLNSFVPENGDEEQCCRQLDKKGGSQQLLLNMMQALWRSCWLIHNIVTCQSTCSKRVTQSWVNGVWRHQSQIITYRRWCRLLEQKLEQLEKFEKSGWTPWLLDKHWKSWRTREEQEGFSQNWIREEWVEGRAEQQFHPGSEQKVPSSDVWQRSSYRAFYNHSTRHAHRWRKAQMEQLRTSLEHRRGTLPTLDEWRSYPHKRAKLGYGHFCTKKWKRGHRLKNERRTRWCPQICATTISDKRQHSAYKAPTRARIGDDLATCKHYTSKYRKMATEILRENNGCGEKLWERMRWTTASKPGKTGTTRITTSSSPCTTSTPMTTLTSTIAWRTTCIESAHIAHCSQSLLMIRIAHSWLKFWAHFISIHGHIHGRISLIRLVPFLPLPPVCPRLLLPPRAVPWAPQHEGPKRVRRPWTLSPLTQVMSPTSWPSASSTTHQFSSPSWSRPRTKTWMTWHSARCSLRHTEDKSTTVYQEACQSVSRRRL